MFNYRKIVSVLSSALMIGSTVGLAAAANYPGPFVSGGAADVAVVYGTTAASTDYIAVVDITSNLQAKLAAQTATGGGVVGGTVTGEAFPLFTSSTKIYLNDSINKAVTVVGETDLPTTLKDGTFQGDVTATYQQQIDVGFTSGKDNKLVFGQHPTSDNDPTFAIDLGTSSGSAVYNLTVTFSKAVGFNNTDSEGESIKLFGTDYTVSSETDATNLYLLKSSTKAALSNEDPSTEVTIDGKTYTVELVSASDSAATVKVTDSDGKSDSKEISEGTSKTVNKLEVGVDTADETNQKLSATLLIGSNKVKLTDNAAIKLGSEATTVDGTNVRFGDGGSERPNNLTKLTFQIAAKDTDVDALIAGGTHTDPIFGSLKLQLAGLSIPEGSTDREEIKISPSGSDKMSVSFIRRGQTTAKSIEWYYNKSDSRRADGLWGAVAHASLADSGGDYYNVFERAKVNVSEYVVLGNEDDGGILELKTMSNTSDNTADTIEFKDIFDDKPYTVSITREGQGTLTYKGKSYTVDYTDNSANSDKHEYVRLKYQDGSRATANQMVVFPTIETSKGAKLMLYEPLKINLSQWDTDVSDVVTHTNVTAIKIPDGDGFTNIAVTRGYGASGALVQNYTIQFGSGAVQDINSTVANAGTGEQVSGLIGQLNFTIARNWTIYNDSNQANADGVVTLFLNDVGRNRLREPAIVVFEEQDDSSAQTYEALIVKIEGAGTTAASLGVSDIETTWGIDTEYDDIQMKSDTDLYKSADFWGSIMTVDQSDTDSYIGTISYPNQQVYAQLYFAETTATITGSTAGSSVVKELGSVSVSDAETSSVSTKNWIVVGGSCVNTAAASLLGSSSPLCGDNWMSKTGVGSGQFLIETFDRTGGKVATLVAGYNAGDTTNAAKYLTTAAAIDTMAGKKYIGTSATSATLQTTTGTATTNSTA